MYPSCSTEQSPGDPAAQSTAAKLDSLPLEAFGRSGRPTSKRILVSVVVSAAIVCALFKITKVPPREIIHRLGGVSVIGLVAGFALHTFVYWLRAVRFKILIRSRRARLTVLFDIMTVHNLMNHVLPFRAGELTYVYLVHRREQLPIGEALGTLVIARIMELMAFCVFCSVSIVWLHLSGFRFPLEYDHYVWGALWSIVPILVTLAAILFFFALKGVSLVERLHVMLLRGRLTRIRLLQRVLDGMKKTAMAFECLRQPKVYLAAFSLSIAIMGMVYGVAYVLLWAIGYRMMYPLVVVCSAIAGFVFLLPLYGLGGVGTVESGWTLGCLVAGFSKTMAVASGFSFHIIVLGYVSVLGIYGILRLGRSALGAREPHLHTQ